MKGRLVIVLRRDEVITIGSAKIKIVGNGGRDKYKVVIVADKTLKIGREHAAEEHRGVTQKQNYSDY